MKKIVLHVTKNDAVKGEILQNMIRDKKYSACLLFRSKGTCSISLKVFSIFTLMNSSAGGFGSVVSILIV